MLCIQREYVIKHEHFGVANLFLQVKNRKTQRNVNIFTLGGMTFGSMRPIMRNVNYIM
jgi:hypothetical protein